MTVAKLIKAEIREGDFNNDEYALSHGISDTEDTEPSCQK